MKASRFGSKQTVTARPFTSSMRVEEYDMPGIKMENSIATGGGARTAWFKDTEGNIPAVSQRVSS